MHVEIDGNSELLRAVAQSLVRVADRMDEDEFADDLGYPLRSVLTYMNTLEEWALEYQAATRSLVG